ncbi:MAG: hypothetical protein Q8P36_00795 [bacterium]|nr:hypothetical protein [bacterium]
MRTISDHIEHVKAQPHHVRERVAFGFAGLMAGIIGIIWLGVSLASGSFAIAGNGFAQATGAAPFTVNGQPAPGDTSGLAGASAALSPGDAAGASAPAYIDVIQDGTSAAPKGAASANQTIIPF